MRRTDHLTNWELIESQARAMQIPAWFRWWRFARKHMELTGVYPNPDGKHGHGVGSGRHAKHMKGREQ